METLIEDEAYDNQIEYLQDTRKPIDMDINKWIQRMKTINYYLPTLQGGAVSLTELQLVKIITRNIPKAWRTQFKLADGHKSRTTIEAQKKLWMLEKEEKCGKLAILKDKQANQQNKGTESSGFKYEYTRCKDNDHEWFDCPKYNKMSKPYKAREAAEKSNKENYALDSSRHERAWEDDSY